MCGIAGFLPADGAPADRELLDRICTRLAHRGPDGYGTYLDHGVALGHRRLSIIDLAGGAQPIANEDGMLQVVFNGEIYNYRQLRADLARRGHRFTTHSDTEVLVHLYEEAGERLPEFLNGMFAFAIWDARKRELFLARDRLGKKPLYYTAAAGIRFAFASELKALTELPGFRGEVNLAAVADFLATGYVGEPDSIFASVRKLPPGCSLLVTASSHRHRRYWELAPAPERCTRLAEAARRLHELAADAVECRMVSDVPLGAFLSGGVDSSGVVALMASRAPDRVKTFSIGFTSEAFDELDYSRLVATRYRTNHHEEIVTPSIGDLLDTLVEHFDEPFGDASAIPTLCLAQMTRRHVTVALSGDGADELLGGYERYAHGLLQHRLRLMMPGWLRRTVLRPGARLYPDLATLPRLLKAKTMLDGLWREPADAYFTLMTTFRDEALDAVLSPDLRRTLAGYDPRDRFRQHFDGLEGLPLLEQFQLVDVKTYLPGDILVKVDRATMACSLEARAPWLDYRVAEFALALPPELKLRHGEGKYLFKHVLRPYLPAQIVKRRKQGFAAPLRDWFRSSLKPLFEDVVLDPDMEAYLSLAEARRLLAEHQTGRYDHGRKLWNLLMLACWDRRWRRKQAGQRQVCHV